MTVTDDSRTFGKRTNDLLVAGDQRPTTDGFLCYNISAVMQYQYRNRYQSYGQTLSVHLLYIKACISFLAKVLSEQIRWQKQTLHMLAFSRRSTANSTYCRDICRSGSADENADDFANQQRAGGPLSSMESETEADTDNILSHGGDLNALSNNRRRRRHKQASYRR